jgi:hypothetical protein
MSLVTNNKNTLARSPSDTYGITLDFTNKRVYWLEGDQKSIEHIFSSDYDFQDQEAITSGSFEVYLLAVFGNSLYFLNNKKPYINQMNVSNKNIIRSIPVHMTDYYDLIVVTSSLQPLGKQYK